MLSKIKLKLFQGRFRLGSRKIFFIGKALEQTDQGSGGITVPGSLQKRGDVMLRTWFSGRHGSVQSKAGLDDSRDFFQP